jgi:hypothetical protein
VSAPIVDGQPLLDALRAAVTAQGVAYEEARKPEVVGARPYIVAFFDSGRVESRSLRGRDGWSTVGTFHCSGLSPESVRFAVNRLRAAVLGLHGQTVDDLQVHVVVGDFRPPPMDRDDDADPPLFIQVDEWRLRTTPS